MSLLCWLPMTDGTVKNNGVSNVQPTNYGAVVNNTGKLGKCYQFGTSSSYIDIPSSVMSNISDECSVCFWLNIISWNTSYATYFQAGTANTAWGNYIFGFLRIGGSNRCCFTISNGSTASNSDYTTPSLELNTWYHITLVYKFDHCLIYINGELYEDYSTSIVPNFSKITRITIGKGNDRTNYQSNCLMNDFRIYNRTLSPEEIHTLSLGLVAHYPLTLTTDEILGDVIEDNETFLVRKAIANKRGMFDEIVGGSVGWNQLVQNGNFANVSTWVTYSNGSYTVSGNIATLSGTSGSRIFQDMPASVHSHKIFISADIQGSGTNGAYVMMNGIGSSATIGTVQSSSWTNVSGIKTVEASGTVRLQLILTGDSVTSAKLRNVILTDLTQMFGTTIADYIYSLEQSTSGAGITYLRSHGFFTKDYYPYNGGEIKSVEGVSEKRTTINYWNNDQLELQQNSGIVKNNDGSLTVSTIAYQERYNSFKIPASLSTLKWYMQFDYECTYTSSTSASFDVRFYYTDGTYSFKKISCSEVGKTGAVILSSTDNKILDYICFGGWSYNGEAIVKNICLNIYDENINGTYYPYSPTLTLILIHQLFVVC